MEHASFDLHEVSEQLTRQDVALLNQLRQASQELRIPNPTNRYWLLITLVYHALFRGS